MSETTGTMTPELAESLISNGEEAQRNRIAGLRAQLVNTTDPGQIAWINKEIAAAEKIIANLGKHIREQIGESLYT